MSSANNVEGSDRDMAVPPAGPALTDWAGAPTGASAGASEPASAPAASSGSPAPILGSGRRKARPAAAPTPAETTPASTAANTVTVDAPAGSPVVVNVNPAPSPEPTTAVAKDEKKDDKPKEKKKQSAGLAMYGQVRSAAAQAKHAAEGTAKVFKLVKELEKRLKKGDRTDEVLEEIQGTFGALKDPLVTISDSLEVLPEVKKGVEELKGILDNIQSAQALLTQLDPATISSSVVAAVTASIGSAVSELQVLKDSFSQEASARDKALQDLVKELQAQGASLEQLARNTDGLQRGIGGVAGKVDAVSGLVAGVDGKMDAANGKLDTLLTAVQGIGNAAALGVNPTPPAAHNPATAPAAAHPAPAHAPTAPAAPAAHAAPAPAAPAHAPTAPVAPPAPAREPEHAHAGTHPTTTHAADGITIHNHVHLEGGAARCEPAAEEKMKPWGMAIVALLMVIVAIILILGLTKDTRVSHDDAYKPRTSLMQVVELEKVS